MTSDHGGILEEGSQLHNHTNVLFICQCVMNKREKIFIWGDRETTETEMTFFYFNSSAGAVMAGSYRELSMMTRG